MRNSSIGSDRSFVKVLYFLIFACEPEVNKLSTTCDIVSVGWVVFFNSIGNNLADRTVESKAHATSKHNVGLPADWSGVMQQW